jgi:general secretion pathway protein E
MLINREVVQKSDIEDKLFKYLQSCGYQTTRKAKLTGKSSIEHSFDLLARVEDGIINSSLVFRFVDSDVKEKQSHTIFNFANKAYDVGIPERIMVTIPDFNQKSIRLARQWNIRIFNAKKVEAITAIKTPTNKPLFQTQEQVKYGNRQEMADSLIRRGYQVQEKAIVTGVSGVTYQFDLIASIGTELWTHNIGIDFLSNKEEVSLEQVSVFDTKAYDSGIVTKIIVAKPKLNFNAKLLAGRQRIKVFELGHEREDISTTSEIREIPGSTAPGPETMVKLSPQPEAVQLIPEAIARRYNTIPLKIVGEILELAMANPADIQAMDAIAYISGKRIKSIVADAKEVHDAINLNYTSYDDVNKQVVGISNEKETPANKKPALNRGSTIFSEIEMNLKIATDHQVNKPVSFQTNLWDSNKNEIHELPTIIRSELVEVYNNMCVVNNLVWLITEIGDPTAELSATYIELCRGIASHLTKILE